MSRPRTATCGNDGARGKRFGGAGGPSMWRTIVSVVLSASFGSVTLARADDAEWSAGLASVKITPDKPVVLAGYAARTKPFETVEQDIYAKALALRDSAGHRAVLATIDLTILPADVGGEVRRRIEEKENLKPADVVLSVSHSHSTPVVFLHPGGDDTPSGNHEQD